MEKRQQRRDYYEKVLDYFNKRYSKSLVGGDRFLSSLYLEEIGHAIVLRLAKAEEECLLSA